MKELKGKVAVITGGAGGIGLAIAEVFGGEGMKLVIADIEQAALDAAVAKLTGLGFEAVGVLTDVTKFDAVESLAEATLSAFGKVHIVVNNAGVSITGPTWEMTLDDWRWVYDVNVRGVIHGIKVFTPILLKQNEPSHIVNTSSLAAFFSIGQHAPYCSSKAAVRSITQALYSELIAENAQIGVSLVCPGFIATQIHRSGRNRPAGDRPWSDRDQSDENHIQNAETFQSKGISPAEVAKITLKAIKENRFYVFVNDEDRQSAASSNAAISNGDNPPIITWGANRRFATRSPL